MAEQAKTKQYTVDELDKPRGQRQNAKDALISMGAPSTYMPSSPEQLKKMQANKSELERIENKEEAIKVRHDRMIASRDNSLKAIKDKAPVIPKLDIKPENEKKAAEFAASPELAVSNNPDLKASLEVINAIKEKSKADGLDVQQIAAVTKMAKEVMTEVIRQGNAPKLEKEQQKEIER
jgi:hypothetical protein